MFRMKPGWKRSLVRGLVVLAPIAAVVGATAWYKFFRAVDQPAFATEDEWFKYGSLGGEDDQGIPYFVWLVLPRIFEDKVPRPGGYRGFGFAWEPGRELPVGFSLKTVGFPRVTNNCALCHAATYRRGPDDDVHVVTGGPAHRTDIQAYFRFLTESAQDPRFNPDTIMGEIALTYDDKHGHGGLSALDKQLYRRLIIPTMRKKLIELGDGLAWMRRAHRPPWAPGRDDSMNLPKYFVAKLPEDGTIGTADFASVWNQQARAGQPLQWDATSPSLRSVIIDSALGVGAPPRGMGKLVERMTPLLTTMPKPPFPKPDDDGRFKRFAIDDALTRRGATLYATHCADCHEPGGTRFGKVIDIAEINTDRGRLDTWTAKAVDATNGAIKQMGIDRDNMVKTNGYMAQPLDGVWLRAPYLHNGSVPTLTDLLKPSGERTKAFVRGYDVYDPENVGFVSEGAEAKRVGVELDTTQPGNGNGGHEYGTRLSEDDRRAIIEFLKTL